MAQAILYRPRRRGRVQYFEAMRVGKQRASEAQMKLFEAAGFAMLTLTTKKRAGVFEPVGEEDRAAVIRIPDGYVALIADGDGCTKAQTKALGKDEAVRIHADLVKSGMPAFEGGAVEIWTEQYPALSL